MCASRAKRARRAAASGAGRPQRPPGAGITGRGSRPPGCPLLGDKAACRIRPVLAGEVCVCALEQCSPRGARIQVLSGSRGAGMSAEAGLNARGETSPLPGLRNRRSRKVLAALLNGCRSPLWSSSARVSRLLESNGLPALGPLRSSIAGVSRQSSTLAHHSRCPLGSSIAGVSRPLPPCVPH